ncbi:His Kinase A (phospho-acceptor) domain-containing protein [Arboricoccus pini]|uniref:histidine kinase n=1 Tax=Arboricoccus pini TaxID=1963835 RepID=A0A212RPY5_9PROT|nr:DAHL domain-containing protein [Arboricoccus pini]SNB74591.1 His Kinase A (phospho-acceptor) domain-containing protein [Arboricoccus pini]
MERRIPKHGWSLAICIVVLAATTASFFLLSHSPTQQFREADDELAELKQTDARWTADILSLELGLNGNYDVVTTPLRGFSAAYERLERTIAAIHTKDEAAAASQALADYKAVMAQKIALVDRIKAQYAVLSNSSRFLSVADSELFMVSQSSDVDLTVQSRIAGILNQLMTSVTSYMVTPNNSLRDVIGQQMQELQRVAESVSPTASSKAATLVKHTDTILRQRQLGNELIVGAVTLPTAKAIDHLAMQLRGLRDQIEAKSLIYRDVGLICLALLAGSLASAGWLLYRHLSRLDASNSKLQLANDEVQTQLIQSAKLSAMGQMVAGITHEINTPLAYVKAVFSLIREQLALVAAADGGQALSQIKTPGAETNLLDEVHMLLEEGLHGIEEIATLILTMKNFSRLDKGRLDEFSVEEGLENALLIARSELKYVADVTRDYGNVPSITGSSSQIKQVFLNLINNAAHAMASLDRRGELTIRTRLEGEDQVVIEIADDGPGIPAAIRDKIFDPFFTTKEVGKGTGMGLSICYRIVHNHGGSLTVNSEEGRGTTFMVLLPIRHQLNDAATADTRLVAAV